MEAREFPVTDATKFDVKVNTGSSLPAAKADKTNLAFKYFESGAFDALELLKATDYPNAEAVYARVQERKMQEAQKQAAMSAPPPAPGGPPPQGPPPPM
jgi:hypothetical protein